MALDSHPEKAESGTSAPTAFIFNGDADGLIAQHILGLELGQPDIRITGGKRDIGLLAKASHLISGHIHALDISLRRNLNPLANLLPYLEQGNLKVTWYDHHDPGNHPVHPNLQLHINQAPETCTAVIVNAVHGFKHPLWAAMGAFGDNLPATGVALASGGGASAGEIEQLHRAGLLLNYNAYGEKPADRLFDPAYLAERMAPFASALEFMQDQSIFQPLSDQLMADKKNFSHIPQVVSSPGAEAYLLPDEAFARRYGATWANEQVLKNPTVALAVMHTKADGTYLVSIRAPRDGRGSNPVTPSASDLAKEFPTGGGRKLAAGIDALPADQFDKFRQRLTEFYK